METRLVLKLKPEITPQEVYDVWYKIDSPDSVFSRTGCRTVSDFIQLFTVSAEIALYPFAMFRFDQHPVRHIVELHGVFWSHKAFKDPPQIQRDLLRIMQIHYWTRAQIIVPAPMRALARWIEMVGFEREGVLRNYFSYDSITTDGVAYSVVKGQ